MLRGWAVRIFRFRSISQILHTTPLRGLVVPFG